MADLNDNERRGLPASIDLLRKAVETVERNPKCSRRGSHLLAMCNRVKLELESNNDD